MHSFPFTLSLDDSASPPQGETVGLLKILEPFQTIHPTVLWESLTHNVSHCTNGGNRWTGIIPNHPQLFLVSTVHPIPLYHYREWTTGIIPRCPIGYTLSLLSIIPYITHSIWQDAFGGLIHPFYHTVYNNTIYISL